ncbi:MAG: STAS domain-containing protein [Acidobacteriota bacterium]
MSDEQQTPWTATADPATGSARIEGELDFTNSLAVRDWLKEFSATTTGELKLDLEGLRYIDSSGLAILIEIRKFLAAQQRGVRILKVSSQVSKLFSLTQIGDLFGI